MPKTPKTKKPMPQMARSFESCSRGGKTQGNKNVESGRILTLHTFISPEAKSARGKIQGTANVASGHWASIVKLGRSAGGKKQGRIEGAKRVETGHIFTMPHIRWHVNKNVYNPNCDFCKNGMPLFDLHATGDKK